MKTCLLAELRDDGEIGGLIDVSLVGDDHQFGPDPDGKRIHVEGHAEMTVTCGKAYQEAPEQPPAVNGVPFSEVIVHEDGTLSYAVPVRRRDPAEAAERIRAGYRELGIPDEVGEAMIEETLRDA